MISGIVLSAFSLAVAQPADAPVVDEFAFSGCMRESEGPTGTVERWNLIDAGNFDHPDQLAAALREMPEGKRAIIAGGDFTRADMRSLAPMLEGACFNGTDLTGTNWNGTSVPDLKLERVSLREATVRGARWPRLEARGVAIEGADFSGADLAAMRYLSHFQGASFRDVSFEGANLTDASIACGITVDVWCIDATPALRDAVLKGADLSGLGLWDEAANDSMVLDNTIVAPRSLASLAGARFDGPLRLATYYASPYGGDQERPQIATISADEAQALIAATREAGAEDDSASFDCARASTRIENLICGEYEYELRALDRELSRVWRLVQYAGTNSLTEQRRWLRSRIDCEDRTCLAEKYEARIAILLGSLGPGIVLAPDQSITYFSDVLPLPEEMREGDLYQRILPVLRDASYQQITLTGREDGSIEAQGGAVGANAHLCDLEVPEARFDPATGWWSAQDAETGVLVPIFRVDGRRIVLRYSGNLGNTPPEAQDFMSCGARAGFDDGIDLAPR